MTGRPATRTGGIGVEFEWGRLREAIVGIAPADQFVITQWAEYMRWLGPEWEGLARQHAGRRLLDVAPETAERMERQVDGLARVLSEHGVRVHRPHRLAPPISRYQAPNEEGGQLYPRDPVLVIGTKVIESAMRIPCRRREVFALRFILRELSSRGFEWIAAPTPLPTEPTDDDVFLEGGDVLLDGPDVYVGVSGCASNVRGASWLQSVLGASYNVHVIALQPDVLHLDCAMGLVRRGLGLRCPEEFAGPLPASLERYEFIEVTRDEAARLAANGCPLDAETLLVAQGNERVDEELRRHGVDVVTVPYDAPVALGGALRCSHHPIWRETVDV
jgi:N-dimethylarginine dimethylaminohydrolase